MLLPPFSIIRVQQWLFPEKNFDLGRDGLRRGKTARVVTRSLQIFAQLFFPLLWIGRTEERRKGRDRSWYLGAKRIWIKPATNRALPYPIPLSRRKEMQVPRLGTRKKPRIVSRHLRTERGRPDQSLSSSPSRLFPVTIANRPPRVFAKRSITICGRRSSMVPREDTILPPPLRNIPFVSIASYHPELLRAIWPTVLFPAITRMWSVTRLPGDYAFYLRQRSRIETADAASEIIMNDFEPKRI